MGSEKTYCGSYKVRVGDINYGGHMGNDKALLLFHDARIHFLGLKGYNEMDIGGPGLIMAEAHIYFKKELFLADEVSVYVHIEDIRGVSFDMHYTIMRSEELVMLGSTKMIAFNYKDRKISKIPEAFHKFLLAHQPD
jgi:acyl-CoA thioesterase FadM